MKNILSLATVLVIALVLSCGIASAQTATYSTVTSAALNTTQLCFIVAATTSMSASGALTGPAGTPQEWDMWVDGEFMKINTVNTTSNQVCVQRGKAPTRAGSHPTASVVFYGPAGASPFILSAPQPTVSSAGVLNLDGQFGSCVSTQYTYMPLINVANGSIWNCLPTAGTTTTGTINAGAYGHWISYGFRQWTTGHPVVNVVDAAYTATLADEFIIMTRMTAARTVTLPAITGIIGKTYIVKNNTESVLTITVAGSASQGVGSNAGTTTIVVNAAASGGGNVGRFISVPTSSGGWSYATW